jgi:enoyl reductase-like protein
MLDKLPAPVRHLLIVVGAAAVGVPVQAVVAAQGVTGVDWADTLVDALNAGGLAGALAIGALWLTPLTRQYGVGARADT